MNKIKNAPVNQFNHKKNTDSHLHISNFETENDNNSKNQKTNKPIRHHTSSKLTQIMKLTANINNECNKLQEDENKAFYDKFLASLVEIDAQGSPMKNHKSNPSISKGDRSPSKSKHNPTAPHSPEKTKSKKIQLIIEDTFKPPKRNSESKKEITSLKNNRLSRFGSPQLIKVKNTLSLSQNNPIVRKSRFHKSSEASLDCSINNENNENNDKKMRGSKNIILKEPSDDNIKKRSLNIQTNATQYNDTQNYFICCIPFKRKKGIQK